MDNKKNGSHDAPGIFMRIIDNWSSILLTTVLCAAAMFSYGRFIMTPQYTSTAVLYTLSGAEGEAGAEAGDTSLARDCAYAAGSQDVLNRVIKEQTLSLSYAELSEKLQISYPEGSHVVEITVMDKSSETAKGLADAIADATLSYVSSEMGLSSPKVLSYGFVGGKTVTILPTTLAGIGALAGLIISLIVCFIRAKSDDRIMLPGDLRSQGIDVIAMVPGEE